MVAIIFTLLAAAGIARAELLVSSFSSNRVFRYDDTSGAFIDIFIATPFTFEERHVRRIGQIAAYEADGSLLPDPRATPPEDGRAVGHGGEDVDAFDPEAG